MNGDLCTFEVYLVKPLAREIMYHTTFHRHQETAYLDHFNSWIVYSINCLRPS